MLHIDDMNLAYLGGFFDGEGSISIERVGKLSQNLSIGVTNCDVRPVELFREYFDGEFIVYTPKGLRVNGSVYATQYRCRVRGPKAEKALTRLLPYLRVKRERAEIAITFEKLRQYHFSLYGKQRHPDDAWQARESLREKILQLNYRVVGHTRQPRAEPQGRVDRSLKAKRLTGVVSICERKEAS